MKTLMMFLGQVLSADPSCQEAVAREAVRETESHSQNMGPYCKARQRLPLALIARFAREAGEQVSAQQPEQWRRRGRDLKVVDGTTVSMPDTEESQAAFPQSRTQKVGLGFPVARIVPVISLSCGAVVDWMVGPCAGKPSGEPSMLRELTQCLRPGDVMIADRYYAGYFVLALLLQCGVDIVVRQRQHRSTDFKDRKSNRLTVSMANAGCSRQSPSLGRHASRFAERPPNGIAKG